MRYVLGFFPPDRLFAIVDALSESHAHGLTISDARGFGQEHDVGVGQCLLTRLLHD